MSDQPKPLPRYRAFVAWYENGSDLTERRSFDDYREGSTWMMEMLGLHKHACCYMVDTWANEGERVIEGPITR